ncbi:MAB_1171c family putative transporter [Streptomyces sp. NPDC101733]|uniref:MAB_1171c family putative transporter n=1 Tax=Streptomyces sp. NPDC101733 TaxID=3366144 RepID=UPI0038074CD3
MTLWVVAIWRLPAAVRIPRQRPLWAAFASIALACSIGIPPVQRLLFEPIGVNNLATLCKHGLGIGGSSAVLLFVITMARPDGVDAWKRRLLCAAAGGTVLLTTFFFLTPRPYEVDNFFEANLGNLYGTLYCLVFLGYLTAAMSVSSRLFWSYARRAAGAPLRAGLALLGAGTAFGALYTTWRTAHMLTRLAGGEFPAGDATTQLVADLLEFTGIALILLGNTVPALGVQWRSLTHRRALRRVEPLWAALIEAVPGVVLTEPTGRGPRLRLHRRLIEIWDAVLVLRAYAPAELIAAARAEAHATALAAGEGDGVREAFAEAFWLRVARQDCLSGADHHGPPPDGEPHRNDTDTDTDTGAGAGAGAEADVDFDFDAEVRKVVALATAYADPRTARFAATRDTELPV